MTATQYRVLGALVAGGYISGQGTRGGFPLITGERQVDVVRPGTRTALLRRGWVAVLPGLWQTYALTDAGRAAYAQAQARRVGEEHA